MKLVDMTRLRAVQCRYGHARKNATVEIKHVLRFHVADNSLMEVNCRLPSL